MTQRMVLVSGDYIHVNDLAQGSYSCNEVSFVMEMTAIYLILEMELVLR